MATITQNSVIYTRIGSSSEVRVSGFSSPPAPWNLVIPSTVTIGGNTYTVTRIGEDAFQNLTTLTSVTIPNTVNLIGNYAFNGCTSLANITIPNLVTRIGLQAFNGCTSLSNVVIGTSVAEIAFAAFRNCTNLLSIFIPMSVTRIESSAFLGCDSLTDVEFDDQSKITNLINNTVFNALNAAPLNKTVKFWNTSGYNTGENPLSANGKLIADYFDVNNRTYNSGASCFNEDTKILCLNRDGQEEYIPIQNLRKGDLVKSYLHGYRKIDLIGKGRMINNIDVWNDSMYILEKTDDNGLIEDLIVTGGHAILVDQLSDQDLQNYKLNNVFGNGQPIMIDDKFLLLAGLSSLFKQLTEQKKFTYYHLILESNDDDERFGVYANGILTETPSKKQFTAHSYTLL